MGALPICGTAAAETPSIGDALCRGIARPGVRIAGGPGTCTLGFLVTDGVNRYATTAGHCLEVGRPVFTSGGTPSVAMRLGVAEAAVATDSTIGEDFGLIRLDDNVTWSAKMCDWGGPTAEFAGDDIRGRVVLHTGYGNPLPGSLEPPRPRAGHGELWGVRTFFFTGFIAAGDSGSPALLQSGEALGVMTAGFNGVIWGTELRYGLEMLGHGNLTLMTAPLNG